MKLFISSSVPVDKHLLSTATQARAPMFSLEPPKFNGQAFLYMSNADPFLLTEEAQPILHYTVVFAKEAEDQELLEKLFALPVLDISPCPHTHFFLEKKIDMYIAQIRTRKSDETARLIKTMLPQKLTQTEHLFLRCLLERGASGANRELLVKTVWNAAKVENKTIDTHLFNLRRKLETVGVFIHFSSKTRIWALTSNNPLVAID